MKSNRNHNWMACYHIFSQKKLALRRWKVKQKVRVCSACDKDITDRGSSVNEHGNV